MSVELCGTFSRVEVINNSSAEQDDLEVAWGTAGVGEFDVVFAKGRDTLKIYIMDPVEIAA